MFDDLVVYAVYLSDPCEHLYDGGTVVDPTCTEEGYTLRTCQNCGAQIKTDFVPALGHVSGEWVVVKEANTQEDGLMTKSCVVCGEVLVSEVIPRLNVPVASIQSADTVIVGTTIDFFVVVSGGTTVNALAVIPQFDTNAFEYVSGEWIIAGSILSNIDSVTMAAVAAWANPIDPNTTIYKFTLRSKAVTANTVVSAEVRMNDDLGPVTMSILPKNLSIIECPHATGTYTYINEHQHSFTCDICGYGEIQEHAFEDADDRLCEECGFFNYIPGDLDNDSDVDSNDGIYLLYYVMYGESEYPLNQPCDFDNDGDVDSDDAIYVVYHSFFGAADYPLVH